ncbi:hypothetical protein [Actinomadura verrucosospora]|uniref:Uncharacterized protein n=1 Tax=Actinomadura verrucosospora TaxID=46165 RepID=A0A7D3VV10_ACTVE|nr:hypothetical protein [Actinomadura verrucosospora]QKG23270.1 hypothetical protein ACTIVE_4913 [Actinomadura verrucosospora]
MPHRVVIRFHSGDEDSLTLARWGDAAVAELVSDLQGSRHVAEVHVLRFDEVPPPAPDGRGRRGNNLGRVLSIVGVAMIMVGLFIGFQPIPHGNGSGTAHDCGSGFSPDSYYQCPEDQRSARNTALMFLIPGIGLVVGGIGAGRRKT